MCVWVSLLTYRKVQVQCPGCCIRCYCFLQQVTLLRPVYAAVKWEPDFHKRSPPSCNFNKQLLVSQ